MEHIVFQNFDNNSMLIIICVNSIRLQDSSNLTFTLQKQLQVHYYRIHATARPGWAEKMTPYSTNTASW